MIKHRFQISEYEFYFICFSVVSSYIRRFKFFSRCLCMFVSWYHPKAGVSKFESGFYFICLLGGNDIYIYLGDIMF